MKEHTESEQTTSRRQFTKAALIAALAAPIAALLAACKSETPQNNSSGQASPAPSPSPEPTNKEGDGSPITVGGGGGKKDERNVSCVFKEDADHFPGDAGNPVKGKSKFKNKKGWKIKTFKIRKDGKWTDYSKELPENGACVIAIQCEGEDTGVTIDGDAFGVEMNTDKYEKQSDGYYRNPNPGEHIIRVTLTVAGHFVHDESFDKDNDGAVCTDFVKSDHSDCPAASPA